MPIYRGEGGSGESSTNALANEVAQDAADAANSAAEAAASATSAANSATAAAASETAAETAETNAENYKNDAQKLAINAEDSQYTLSDGSTTGYSALHYAAKAEAAETATENFNTNLVVTASGLSEGASPTVSYDDVTYTMSFGIPVGATGATGATGPQGPTGTAATIAVGTVSTGAAGSSATVTNSGTSSAAVFDFSIPKGDTGATGATGATGPQGPAGADGADGADGIQLTDLSVTTNTAGTAALTYNNTLGVFSYTPPDLSGYLTSYTETDTLDSVTGRGATTTNAVTVGNLTSTGIDDNATSTAITIDSSQNAGIGTTSTSGVQGLLHIHSSSDDNGDGDGEVNFGDESTVIISTNATSAGAQGYYGSLFFGGQDVSSATQQVWKLAGISAYSSADLGTTGSADLLFYTTNSASAPSERMRIDSSGNVGIKETNPGSDLHITDGFPRITLEDSGDSSISYIDVGGGFLSFTSQTNATTHGKISLKTYNGTTTNTQFEINGVTGYSAFKKAVQEQEYSLTGTVINPANGTIQYKTLGANTTFTKTNWLNGAFVTLMIDDGSAYTVTWPTITWVGGSAPALGTTGYNVIHLWQINSVLYGAFIGTTA